MISLAMCSRIGYCIGYNLFSYEYYMPALVKKDRMKSSDIPSGN